MLKKPRINFFYEKEIQLFPPLHFLQLNHMNNKKMSIKKLLI